MKKQDGDTRKLLRSEISKLLMLWRPSIQQSPELIGGYVMALDDATATEIQLLVYRAIRTKWNFMPPAPGELREVLIQIRDDHRSQQGSKYSYRNEKERDVETGLEITVRVYTEEGKEYRAYRPQDCPEGRAFLKSMYKLKEEWKPTPRFAKKGGMTE